MTKEQLALLASLEEATANQGRIGADELRALATELRERADDAGRDPRMVTRLFGVTVKSIDVEKRTVDVVASSAAVDSFDEIVEQDWDLARYKANPVVLWNHNKGAMFAASPTATLPIGFATRCKVEDGLLVATLCFVDEKANPTAELVWQGWVQGSIRAVSVGFAPKNVRAEMRDGREVFVLSGNELHEISAVPIGANPEAVARSRAKAIEQLRTLATGGANEDHTKEPHSMNLAMIAALLCIPMTSTENDVTEAVRSTKATADKVPSLEADVRAYEARIKALETDGSALRSQNATLVTERDAATKRAETESEKSLAVELKALIGVKLEPHEVSDADGKPGPMAELAKTNRPLFDKMIGQRTAMKGLGQKSALETHKAEVGTSTAPDDLSDIDAKVEKAAE